MATITRCDGGCGAESPTPSGHVANHWIKLRARKNQDFEKPSETEDKIFCSACWDRVADAMRPEVK